MSVGIRDHQTTTHRVDGSLHAASPSPTTVTRLTWDSRSLTEAHPLPDDGQHTWRRRKRAPPRRSCLASRSPARRVDVTRTRPGVRGASESTRTGRTRTEHRSVPSAGCLVPGAVPSASCLALSRACTPNIRHCTWHKGTRHRTKHRAPGTRHRLSMHPPLPDWRRPSTALPSPVAPRHQRSATAPRPRRRQRECLNAPGRPQSSG